MNLTPEYYPWLDALLVEDADSIRRALTQLPADKLAATGINALELVWQLHPDEDIRKETQQVLKKQSSDKKLKAVAESFEVFRSIIEIMPWEAENSSEIQQRNFAAFRNVMTQYEELFAKYPFYTEIYLDLARKLFMLFQLEMEAELCFNGIVQYNTRCDEALYALGRINERSGKMEVALEYYEKCLEVNPDYTFAHLQAGMLKSNEFQRYQEAIEHFNKVVEIDPYSAEPYIRMAESYYLMGENERCKQFLEIALGINEYHEEALNLSGMLQWKVEKNHEKAIVTFQKGIDHKIHNDSALLLRSLGEIYAQQLQDFDKARLYYEKSLKINQGQKQIIQQFIPILLRVFHDHAAVAEHYENYLKKQPNDAEILTQYAAFLVEYLHDYELAHIQLQQALQADPESLEAQKLLSRIGQYVAPQQTTKTNQKEEEEDDDDDDDDDDWVEIEEVEVEDEDDDDDDDDDGDDDDFSGGSAAGDN